MKRKVANWAAILVATTANASALAADRYDFLFTEAGYSSPDQSELNYTSFVGDKQTGAIFSCMGRVNLNQKTGNVVRHTKSSCGCLFTPRWIDGRIYVQPLKRLGSYQQAQFAKNESGLGFLANRSSKAPTRFLRTVRLQGNLDVF